MFNKISDFFIFLLTYPSPTKERGNKKCFLVKLRPKWTNQVRSLYSQAYAQSWREITGFTDLFRHCLTLISNSGPPPCESRSGQRRQRCHRIGIKRIVDDYCVDFYLLLHNLGNYVPQCRHSGARNRLGNQRVRLEHHRVESDHAQHDIDSCAASHEICKVAGLLPKLPQCAMRSHA